MFAIRRSCSARRHAGPSLKSLWVESRHPLAVRVTSFRASGGQVMFLRFCAALLVLTAASAAHAGLQFAQYEGSGSEQTGMGGTKISRGGVEFWTTGTPPRHYRILGVLTDTRYEAWGKKAVGSPGVAARIRELGGDAVIVLGRQDRSDGAYIVPLGSSVIGGDDVKTETQLQVIKYLD